MLLVGQVRMDHWIWLFGGFFINVVLVRSKNLRVVQKKMGGEEVKVE